MKRRQLHSIALMLCAIWHGLQAQAQQAHSLTFNDYAPQHLDLQLASQPQSGFFAFPGIGNASVAFSNSMLHPATWLTQSSNEDLATLNLDEVYSAWDGSNRLAADVQVDWFQFGKFFKGKRSFVHGGIREFAHISIALPSDLLRLPFTGNANSELLEGGSLDFSDLGFKTEQRRSFYLGWQRNWSEKWSTGIRLNYLRGIRHAQFSVQNVGWQTDASNWDWSFSGEGMIQSSGMWPLMQLIDSGNVTDAQVQQIKDELLTGVGNGFAIDLGVEYRIHPSWMAFAQINDVGGIQWKEDVKNYTTQPTSVAFAGLELSVAEDWAMGEAEDSLATWGSAIAEDLEEDLALSENSISYRTGTGAVWSVGTEFIPWPDVRWKPSLGMMLRKRQGLPLSWRTSWNQQWGKWMKTSLTFGVRDGLGSSAGMSVALNAGPLLITVAADSHRMLNWTAFSWQDSATAERMPVYLPTNAPSIQVQLGVVWRMGWMSKSASPPPKPECEPFALPSSTSSPQF